MASITKRPNGDRWIQFVDPNGRRQTIRLGQLSQQAAETIKAHVARLVEAKLSGGAMGDETARWLGKVGQTLLNKLVAVNLIAARETATLEAFLDDYVAGRADVKASTTIVYRHTQRCLVKYFGAGKPLGSITRGDADAWRICSGQIRSLATTRCGGDAASLANSSVTPSAAR